MIEQEPQVAALQIIGVLALLALGVNAVAHALPKLVALKVPATALSLTVIGHN